MSIQNLITNILNEPAYIIAFIAAISLFISLKNSKKLKQQAGLNKMKLNQDFTTGFERMKRIFQIIRTLNINSKEKFNKENLLKDKIIFIKLIDEIKESEQHLKLAHIDMSKVYSLLNYSEKIIDKIDVVTNKPRIDYQEFFDLKSDYSFFYFTAYFASPKVEVVGFNYDRFNEDFETQEFLDYHTNLSFLDFNFSQIELHINKPGEEDVLELKEIKKLDKNSK